MGLYMDRVAIYNRCSTEEECQKSALTVQIAESREIAAKMKWDIVEQYVEMQSGTSTRKRIEYQRMIEGIESGRFDIVMIKSIDRLARNTKDWYLFLDCITRNNVKLYLYLEQRFYKSEDALITGIKAILAEEFSKELSCKIRNAHKRRQEKQTGLNITRDMFGWDKIEQNKYKVNETEAEFYCKACELVEQGYGYCKIAKEMQALGATQKNGNVISAVQWRNMLRSTRYYGTVILHKDEYNFETKKRSKVSKENWIYVNNALPPIISKEYHEQIIGILNKRAVAK